MGKGNKKLKADPLEKEEIEIMYEKNVLGTGNPESLLNTVWLNNGVYFGLRGRQDHSNMLCGDVELKMTSDGKEYLEFTEKSTKTTSGKNSGDCRKVLPKAFQVPEDDNCPIKIYKAYRDRRPLDMREPDSRFYLKPLNKPKSEIWYSRQCVGKNKMGTIMKDMASKCDLQGRKVNHSSRKTFGQTLLNGGRPLTEVADLGGWKSIESVKSYVTPSIKQQQMASDTISSMLIPSTESNASISEADEAVLDKLSPTGATCTSTSSEIYSSTVDVASIDTQLQSVHTSDLPLAAVPLGNSSVNINEQSTVNNLNMPTFDMSKINGILYGANISCGTFNFHFNANKQ